MENLLDEKQKLPTSVKVVSIIQLAFNVLGLIGTVLTLAKYESVKSLVVSTGGKVPSFGVYAILGIIVLVELIGVILIMNKNKIGIFVYFAAVIINFIISIAATQFSIGSLVGLVLPILMAIFIFQNKKVYFN